MKIALALLLAAFACLADQAALSETEVLKKGQAVALAGRLDEALGIYRDWLEHSPDSSQVAVAAGVLLDLLGRTTEARQYFGKAIETAPDGRSKSTAERAMAISYAFDNDCQAVSRFEQQAFEYDATVLDFNQQGEIADEAGRSCLESGDPDAASDWYRRGHEAALKEPKLEADRVALWDFRWEHAQARIAARRGQLEQAREHMAATKRILDDHPGIREDQASSYQYLSGYLAFYSGDYQATVSELKKADAYDPFIQCLLAQAYEKLGDRGQAIAYYRRTYALVGLHDSRVAYARPLARRKLHEFGISH